MEVKAKRAAVASPHRLASAAGIKILKRGGNAVDAAVTAAFTLGVVAPGWSGIGGGGFLLAYLSNSQECVAIDYRETAPIHAKRYRVIAGGKVENDANSMGYKAVAVPGTLAGLSLALEEYGTISLKEALEPAIHYAERGFKVTPFWHNCIKMNLYGALNKISRFPETARTFTKNGRLYEPGEKMVYRHLSQTFKKIADKGKDIFYNGEIADAIADHMVANDGWITKEDLIEYEAKRRTPVVGTYRNYEIISMSSPASGATLIQILNILEGFDLKKLGHNTPEMIHLMVEAMKLAFADREKYIADPDFVPTPTEKLTSKDYAEKLRLEINPKKASVGVFPYGLDEGQLGGTAHISVIDNGGNMASLTESLECFLGSGVTIPETGICMNDEMHDFELEIKSPNSIEPKKRPRSSMIPTIMLKDGYPFMALGSSGGSRIITSTLQCIINVVEFNMELQSAINATRFHYQNGTVFVESRIPKKVREELEKMGHKVIAWGKKLPSEDYDLFYGGVHAVLSDRCKGRVYGGADPRKDGCAMHY
ncbi:MAG: gamma-glutamyltransferase [Candidatus Bathyarchaeia archaeon]